MTDLERRKREVIKRIRDLARAQRNGYVRPRMLDIDTAFLGRNWKDVEGAPGLKIRKKDETPSLATLEWRAYQTGETPPHIMWGWKSLTSYDTKRGFFLDGNRVEPTGGLIKIPAHKAHSFRYVKGERGTIYLIK